MAPEVIKQTDTELRYLADIWSLGCCVVEMLTGRPPWSEHGKNVTKIMEIVANTRTPPKMPPNISEDCQDFLRYCFEINPFYRPTAEDLLSHPFVNQIKFNDNSGKSSIVLNS